MWLTYFTCQIRYKIVPLLYNLNKIAIDTTVWKSFLQEILLLYSNSHWIFKKFCRVIFTYLWINIVTVISPLDTCLKYYNCQVRQTVTKVVNRHNLTHWPILRHTGKYFFFWKVRFRRMKKCLIGTGIIIWPGVNCKNYTGNTPFNIHRLKIIYFFKWCYQYA